jgi:3-phosphoshikimate 1-carboxyvinyltransferase
MELLHLSKPGADLRGTIALDGSKSISNRALIVLALAGADPAQYLRRLSTSKDTVTLLRLLTQNGDVLDAGDAGTTFRFMTAYLATRPGAQVLTGSARMRERPVGALVEGLRALGANIEFLEKEGYPPLKIGDMKRAEGQGRATVNIHAGTSSQFLSALLLIAPYLPGGLELVPEGPLVSRPYLEMTVKLMQYFGGKADWQGERIVVEPGEYEAKSFTVEADWSAASYWYSMAAFAQKADLRLEGLFKKSWQGDSVLGEMMERFGVRTEYDADGVRLTKSAEAPRSVFEWDFVECPDIAQTLAVVCAGLGVRGIFSGLETLYIKETDRITAIKNELAKTGASFAKLPKHFSKKQPEKTFFLVDGKALLENVPRFATYGDHRMAMAFAPLAFLGPVEVEHPEVVRKSYPQFWEHLEQAGFEVRQTSKEHL